MEKPRRAVSLDLMLWADTRKDLIDELNQIIFLIETDQFSDGCSGGHDSTYTYRYQENEHPTHDEYVGQLLKYLKEKPNQ